MSLAVAAKRVIVRRKVYLIKCVGQTGHQSGFLELCLLVLEVALLLYCERGGLKAKLLDSVSASIQVLDVRGSWLQDWACVGNTTSLDLQVCKPLQLIICQCLASLHALFGKPCCKKRSNCTKADASLAFASLVALSYAENITATSCEQNCLLLAFGTSSS